MQNCGDSLSSSFSMPKVPVVVSYDGADRVPFLKNRFTVVKISCCILLFERRLCLVHKNNALGFGLASTKRLPTCFSAEIEFLIEKSRAPLT